MKKRRHLPSDEFVNWGQRWHYTEYGLLIAVNADERLEVCDELPLVRTMIAAIVAEADRRDLLVPEKMRLDLPYHNPDEFRIFNHRWAKDWFSCMLRVQAEHQEVTGGVVQRTESLVACVVADADLRAVPVPDEVRDHLPEPLRHLAGELAE
jgi:hypothetical protein